MGRFDNWQILKISEARLEELLARTYQTKSELFDLISEIRAEGEGGASKEEEQAYLFEDLFYLLLELNYYRRLLREHKKIRPIPMPIFTVNICERCGTQYEIESGEYKFCPKCGGAINETDCEK